MKIKLKSYSGFSLIEVLLVLVIISSAIVMGSNYLQQRTLNFRIDRTTAQMQQISNSALAYYVANSAWPAGITGGATGLRQMMEQNYLPTTTYFLMPTPWGNLATGWGNSYYVGSDGKGFFVWAGIPKMANTAAVANQIASGLPLAYTSSDPWNPAIYSQPPSQATPCVDNTKYCWVVAQLNAPGYNLNNATAINYAGLFNNGGCIPAPACPTGTKAKVYVVPAGLSGRVCTDQTCSTENANYSYPVTSFTAFVTPQGSDPQLSPPSCNLSSNNPAACFQNNTTPYTSGKFWRACLDIYTEYGRVDWDSTANGLGQHGWGNYGSLMAFTRCASPEEDKKGSDLSVWTN